MLCESAITRSERRTAPGTSTRMPLSAARVRLREARVDQVVHRDDPAKAPPQRGGARQAVHELDARARGEQGQQRLLAEHPLRAVARVHGDGHGRQQLAPGPSPAAAASRLTKAVKRSPGGRRGEQRGDQLARDDLHATGLARHEEDQVEPDVHVLLDDLELRADVHRGQEKREVLLVGLLDAVEQRGEPHRTERQPHVERHVHDAKADLGVVGEARLGERADRERREVVTMGRVAVREHRGEVRRAQLHAPAGRAMRCSSSNTRIGSETCSITSCSRIWSKLESSIG